MTQQVRVRFAPSPTGYLHVGGLRTALYNYLFARSHGGRFVLRIEDTDQSRKVEGAVDSLIQTLKWAGIEYDEGPGVGGEAGPYVQSERLTIYHDHAARLLELGHAYYCFCSPERLDDLRKRQQAEKQNPGYDRHCRDLPRETVAERLSKGERHVIRMKVPIKGELSLDDVIRGRVTIAADMLDDQVIIKGDGYPTYHLAVVVDDHLMGITHVIRGEEWLPSTPKHVLLYQYFGWELPVYAHLPLLLNPDRSKLSKRQGDVAVEEYRAKGFLPEALVNFVALLGWNPGDDREIFTLEDLVGEFMLERVGKSGAIFNLDKLNWLNFQHMRRKSDATMLELVKHALNASPFKTATISDDTLGKIIESMRERATFVQDFVDKCPYFYGPPVSYDPDVVKKRWKAGSPDQLKALSESFAALPGKTKEEYEAALNATADRLGVARGELIHPLRLALTGVGAGPGLYDIVYILGREETLRRIDHAIERLAKP
jgi:glutamyl-tRNA synthetase